MNFKYIKYGMGLFLLTLFLASCTEKIDIELDESYTRLVVEGAITTDTMAHTISLNTTTSYYYEEPAPGVTNAVVTLNDGESTITLSETSPGRYQTPADYFGIPGRTYKLGIRLNSPLNGEDTYTAESTMNLPAPLDSIRAVYHEDWGTEGFYEIKCYVLDPLTTDYYQFKVLKNNTMLTDSLNKVLITDDRFYNGNYTNGIGVGYLNQAFEAEKVAPGDQLTIQSSRISETFFRFVTELQIQSGFQTPLFSGPPANVQGNISGGAIGYFTTYPVNYTSTTVTDAK
ncbi:MAG: DUF4249 domain-containing protein [Bacteroidales bacterium]|nr:DUF4249 domain-containing protein [Bacteroidales bacterium]